MMSCNLKKHLLACLVLAAAFVFASPQLYAAEPIAILGALANDGVNVAALNDSELSAQKAKVQFHMSQYGGYKIEILNSRGQVVQTMVEAAFAPIGTTPAYQVNDGIDTRADYYGPAGTLSPSGGTVNISDDYTRNKKLFTVDAALGWQIIGHSTDRMNYFVYGVSSDPLGYIPEGYGIGRSYNLGYYGTILDPDGYANGQYPRGYVKQYTIGSAIAGVSDPTWFLNRIN